jgi:antitoxin VapB
MAFEVVDIDSHDTFQDIKIPGKYKIDDDKVYLKKTGNVIYIIPYHKAWESMFDSVNNFSDDFMDEREQPANQHRENFDL